MVIGEKRWDNSVMTTSFVAEVKNPGPEDPVSYV